MVLFGPDGNLWVSLGDGANASAQGQDPGTLFATISRLDVDGPPADGLPYAIPADNPFVDGGGAPEVWAYGLRNPWRFTIDAKSVIVADVGLEQREEIDVLPLRRGGWNLGWPIVEGTACFAENPCDPSQFVVPVARVRPRRGVRHHRRPRLPGQGDPRDQGSLFLWRLVHRVHPQLPHRRWRGGRPAGLDRATRWRSSESTPSGSTATASSTWCRTTERSASWSRSVRTANPGFEPSPQRQLEPTEPASVFGRAGRRTQGSKSRHSDSSGPQNGSVLPAGPDFSPSRNSPETRVRNRAPDPEGGGGR